MVLCIFPEIEIDSMDFPIEERSGEVPLKPEGRRVEHPKEAPPPPPFGHGVSSHFEDDLMREFESKHSNLSTFLDERVSDLTFGISSQVELKTEKEHQHVTSDSVFLSGHDVGGSEEQRKVPDDTFFLGEQYEKQHHTSHDDYDPFEAARKQEEDLQKLVGGIHQHHGYDPFEAARKQEEDLQKLVGGIHHHDGYDPFEAARKQEEDLNKLVGDFGGGLKKTEPADSQFKLKTGDELFKTEQAAGGDHGKFLAEEHESQFERVSPNMMEYNFENISTTRDSTLPSEKAQEVPFSFGTNSGLNLSQQPPRPPQFGMDDDEDDFERDSISQQSQSQPLSNKLSDSLEALKDIPKEISPPVQDHFAPPSSLRPRGRDDEDDFEKDSISSHPLSQKLSDSLEVLKDSPQKDLQLDESLMGLDDLPSSKNSVNSISPNDIPNLGDDFAEITGASRSEEDLIGKVEEPVVGFSPVHEVPESGGNPFMESEKSTSSQLSSDFSGPVAVSDLVEGTSSLPEVAQSASFAPPDVGNVSPFGNLPEVASTVPSTTEPPKNMDDMILRQQNIPDLTAYMEAPLMEEEMPPPVPPHKNLPVSEPHQGIPSSMYESQIGIHSVHSPFEGAVNKDEDLIEKYGVEDPMLEEAVKAEQTSERPAAQEDLISGGGTNIMTSSMTMSSSLEAITQPNFYESEDSSAKTDAPLLDFESKDQQSVTEDLDDLLQSEAEPVLEFLTKSKEPDLFQEALPPKPHEPEPVLEHIAETTKQISEAFHESTESDLFDYIPQEVPEPVVPQPVKGQPPVMEDIPPPVPPHRQPLQESPTKEHYEELITPPSPVEKVIEEPKVLPPEPPKPVIEVSEEKPKVEPKVEVKAAEKPKKLIEDFQPVEVSEEVQLILNTFDPSKSRF